MLRDIHRQDFPLGGVQLPRLDVGSFPPLLPIEHSMHFYPSHVFKDNFFYFFQLMNKFSTCYYTLNSLLPTTLQPHLHLLRTTFVLGLDTDT